MSQLTTIQSELTRIRTQLDDCFTAVSEKGVSTPTQQADRTLLALSTLIRSISQSGEGGGSGEVVIIEGNQITVPLGNGIYNNETKLITWWCGNGAIQIVQSKATSGTVVNQTFISAPRLYKAHTLSFLAQEGIFIDEIEIKYSGQYRGHNLTLGVAVDDNGDVVPYTGDDLSIELDTITDGTHVITANGFQTIILQNVSDSSNVQLRITDIHIKFHTNDTEN